MHNFLAKIFMRQMAWHFPKISELKSHSNILRGYLLVAYNHSQMMEMARIFEDLTFAQVYKLETHLNNCMNSWPI